MAGVIATIGFGLFPLWVDAKWEFVIASIISGVGMGILLCAPLNILATEKLEENKGTALASLSLLRTIGMTLAPTIYAGFIARGFSEVPSLFKSDFPTILQNNIQNANLSQEGLAEVQQIGTQFASGGEISQDQMIAAVANIQDPSLKEVVSSSVTEVTKLAAENGYGGLFMSAAVIAFCIIVVGFILQPIRKKSLN